MNWALRASLFVNAALAILVGALALRGRPPSVHESTTGVKPALNAGVAPAASSSPVVPALNGIVRLEMYGFSRDAIAQVVLDEFNRRWNVRIADLKKQTGAASIPSREYVELGRERDADLVRELKEKLGEAGYEDWDREQTLHELNRARLPGDDLPMSAEEQDVAWRLQKAYEDKSKELQIATEDGLASQTDSDALRAQAQATLDQGLEQMLGSERFAALRGDADPLIAVNQRYPDLNPTAQQAAAVMQADAAYRDQQAALTQQAAANPSNVSTLTAQMEALADAHDASLRQIFGGDAFDVATKAADPSYQALAQNAGAWNLDDQQVQAAYQNLRAYDSKAESLRSAAEMDQEAGRPVNWRDVDGQIEQAREQAEAALQGVVGSEGVTRMESNGLLSRSSP
ncbi:MAG TPA: hypothetical protein VGL42_13640 [Opitutaceae bacterium]|jgi:hypothetical protein